MKKALSTILLIISFSTYIYIPACSENHKKLIIKGGIKKEYKQELSPVNNFKMPILEDEAAELLKAENAKKTEYKQTTIEDEAASIIAKEKKEQKHKYKQSIVQDEQVITTEENKKVKKIVYTGKVKTENGAEVLIKPLHKIRTKNSYIKVKKDKEVEKYKIALPEIGQRVGFKVVRDVTKNGKVIVPKDTIVYAKIGEVSPRAMGGAPAELTLEKFEMIDDNGKIVPLDGTVSSSGYSLSVWIGVVELATTPFLFGLAAPLLRVLPGGQAIVSPKKNYVVYY